MKQVTDRVVAEAATEYRMAGVRWYAGGVFHRETVRGDEMSARYVTPLKPGALIYNRLFAWKESFAYVTAEHEGLFVSNEFPQFIPDTSRVLSEFLYLFCTIPSTTRLVNAASAGSAAVSRNRFKESEFTSFTEHRGTPILRMNNVHEGVMRFGDIKHIELPSNERARLLMREGDILFNRTNSKELVGKCAVFHSTEEYVYASYLIRVRTNDVIADPDYVAFVINGPIGRQQIDGLSRQIIGQANVNSQELRSLRIPLPPLSIQKQLVAEVTAAREHIAAERAAAAKLAADTAREVEEMILGQLRVPTSKI